MKHLILPLLLLLHSALQGQQVNATADSTQLIIGDRMQLKLEAIFPQGKPVSFFTVDTFPHFEILSTSKMDTLALNNQVHLTQTLTLTSWDSGKWQIPSFALGKLLTRPLTVNIVFNPSPFDRDQPYHDIRDILDVKKPPESKWWWYLIFAVILLALFMLFFPGERKKKEAGFVADTNAYQQALADLDKLSKSPPQDPVAAYTSLVQVFRDYLQKRKNIRSHSRTSDDLLLQVSDQGLTRDEHQKLQQTLRLADMVKFAKMRPAGNETTESISVVKESIIILEHHKDVI